MSDSTDIVVLDVGITSGGFVTTVDQEVEVAAVATPPEGNTGFRY